MQQILCIDEQLILIGIDLITINVQKQEDAKSNYYIISFINHDYNKILDFVWFCAHLFVT